MSEKRINGDRIYLRPLDYKEVEQISRWHNDKEIMTLIAISKRKSKNYWYKWFDRIENDLNTVYFGIVNKSDDKLIGYVHLEGISWQHKLCRDIGILIGERDEWSKGYGTEAMKLMIDYAFRDLGLHRLELMTFPFNKRGLRVWEKCGFTQEGIMRKARSMNGKWHDLILMSLLENEYKN